MNGMEAQMHAMATGQKVRREDFHAQVYVEWNEAEGQMMSCWSPIPSIVQRVPCAPGLMEQPGEWSAVPDKPVAHTRSVQTGICEGCGAPEGLTCEQWATIRAEADEAIKDNPRAMESAVKAKRNIDASITIDAHYVASALIGPMMATLMVRYNTVLNTQTMRRDARKALDRLDRAAGKSNKDYIEAATEAAALLNLLLIVRTTR